MNRVKLFFSLILILALGSFLWRVSNADIETRENFAPLFPFLISYDNLDCTTSMEHLLDAPAGKYGFIRIEEGHFANDAGRINFNGTNLTGPANFPTHEQAGPLAERLAHFGINCVRLHYMDADYGNFRNDREPGIIANDLQTQRNLDSLQLDKLDYLIAAFKKRGIYVNINLHVARFWDERDGFGGKDKRPWADKGLDNFEPRMIDLQKEYARKLLTHVNPYTGMAYTDDPCVAMIEINNENALFREFHDGAIDRLPEPYAGEFQKQWNVWLRKKYPSGEALSRAWKKVNIPLNGDQIEEGRFDKEIQIDGKKWQLDLGSAEASVSSEEGVLKVYVNRPGNDLFPKLYRSISIKKNQPYTLTFRIRSVGEARSGILGMAVADQKNGWRSLGLLRQITVDSAWKTYTFSFVATEDSEDAQFQLTRFNNSLYEIDDLSFQHGAAWNIDPLKLYREGNVPVLYKMGYAPTEVTRDFYQFLVDTEQKYWTGIHRFLKDELKVKSVISGTQLGYSPPFVQAELDYIDVHSYWCHPGPVNPNWQIRNESMVNSMTSIRTLASQRIDGKPYTVSEYNHPFPNQYGAEGQPMLRAYGRFQGWDGVFEYTYNHRSDFTPNHNSYFFSMMARTDVLAHLPACAGMYLRGDVREAESAIVVPLGYGEYFDRLVSSKAVGAGVSIKGIDQKHTLLHKTAVELLNEKEAASSVVDKKIPGSQKVFVSDTEELTWNIEKPDSGYFTVNTPNTKLFTGFPAGRLIKLGGVELSIGKTRLDWATISLVSRNAAGFGEDNKPTSILLCATGLVENKGMMIRQLSGKQITLSDWGGDTMLAEGIPAIITFSDNRLKVTCFALGPDGKRIKEVPVKKMEDGRIRIIIDPLYQTIWYEIDMR